MPCRPPAESYFRAGQDRPTAEAGCTANLAQPSRPSTAPRRLCRVHSRHNGGDSRAWSTAAGGPRAEPPRLGRGYSVLGHRRHLDLAVAPAVMQVQLRRSAARRELAAATSRRSEEFVSGTTKINRIIFWKALTHGRRRRIVGTQRRFREQDPSTQAASGQSRALEYNVAF